MFIICPKCSAKYKIPEGIQLESGQKLKCSACDFVFLKGEEAPLTLDNTVPQSESPAAGVFSEPLHSADELKTTPADSLPEAFKPVDTPKKKKGVGLVFLYLIFVAALCALGWMYRDSLKPSMQTAFPSLTLDETKIPPKVRQNALPVRPKKVKPVNQPTIQVEDLAKAEPVKSTPKKAPEKMPKKPVEKPAAVVAKAPVPEPPTPQEKPIMAEVKEPVAEAEIVLPEPALNAQPIPVMPDPIIVPEPEVVPLFEVIEEPLPAATAAELSVNAITFRIEPTEEGIDQVLIEGQIQNTALQKKSVPVLTVLAVNKDGQILAQKKVHTAGDSLDAGAQISFYTSMIPAPADLDHIEVQF